MTEKTKSALVQSIAGIVFIMIGLAVFAIRLKHEGPYVVPGGWAFYGAIGLYPKEATSSTAALRLGSCSP